MHLDKEVFYNKSNTLRINAFVTRINKSKAQFENTKLKYGSYSTSCTCSPYFSASAEQQQQQQQQQSPLICSLLEHEAEAYGYKLASQSGIENETSFQLDLVRNHKRITKPPLFTPSTASELYIKSRIKNLRPSKQTFSRDSSEISRQTTSYFPSYSSPCPLRDKLNRNVSRVTRKAMVNACKRYPPLSTRQVLDKYAHLFGLQPVTPVTSSKTVCTSSSISSGSSNQVNNHHHYNRSENKAKEVEGDRTTGAQTEEAECLKLVENKE